MRRKSPLRIGTRASPLALAQAYAVRDRLAQDCVIIPLSTTGDCVQDRPLAEVGGKGLFTKEIDAAMLRGDIDIAVHSAKDLPTLLPEGIHLAGFLPREDVRDAFISTKACRLQDLPHGATLGTASPRREAQVLLARPDLRVVLLRGNVETRLKKVESGEIDATLLAFAGLKRLGLAHRASALLDVEMFLPAVGQGALAITAGSGSFAALLAPLVHIPTTRAVSCERAFLAVLGGSCRTPIAGYAWEEEGQLHFRGAIYGHGQAFTVALSGGDAESLGAQAGRDLRAKLPTGILS